MPANPVFSVNKHSHPQPRRLRPALPRALSRNDWKAFSFLFLGCLKLEETFPKHFGGGGLGGREESRVQQAPSSLIGREQGCERGGEPRLKRCRPTSPWLIRPTQDQPPGKQDSRWSGPGQVQGDKGTWPEGMVERTRIHLLKEAEGPRGPRGPDPPWWWTPCPGLRKCPEEFS